MGTSKQRTWWQEMGAISRGLMFFDGSIATQASLQESERLARRVVPASPKERAPRSSMKRKARRFLEDLMLLGGRPVAVRRNDDIDEPFPPVHGRHARNRRRASAARSFDDDTAGTRASC